MGRGSLPASTASPWPRSEESGAWSGCVVSECMCSVGWRKEYSSANGVVWRDRAVGGTPPLGLYASASLATLPAQPACPPAASLPPMRARRCSIARGQCSRAYMFCACRSPLLQPWRMRLRWRKARRFGAVTSDS